jgi:phage shock protein C
MEGKGEMTARTIYRDTERKKLTGVVAGLAEHFGWNVKYARWGWVIATLFWPPVMIAAYILMSWLLDPKPRLGLTAASDSSTFATVKLNIDTGAAPSAIRNRFSDVRDRFGRLEQRLRSLEKVVTSREFQMDRELRKT